MLLNHRYRLQATLGKGANSTVFQVLDMHHQRLRALKLLHAGADEALLRGEFIRLSRLSHPNLVSVHDLDRCRDAVRFGDRNIEAGRLFLVMDLVPGGREAASVILALPPDQRDPWLRGLARDLASALAHMHEHGLVHHDLKPDNFLIDETGRAVLFDLGLSTAGLPLGDARGTLAYMAPEALGGRGDHRVDLYSLGAALFEVCSGQRPFMGQGAQLVEQILQKPAELSVPWLSADLRALILRLLCKDPLKRPPSARFVQIELCRMTGDHEGLARLAARRELMVPGFIGREAQLRHLAAWLAQVPDGQGPRVVLVSGGAGVGKSRLIEECIRQHRIEAAAGHVKPLTLVSGALRPHLVRHFLGEPEARPEGGAGSERDIRAFETNLALRLLEAMEGMAHAAPLVVHVTTGTLDPLWPRLVDLLLREEEGAAGPGSEAQGPGPRAPVLVLAEILADALAPDSLPEAHDPAWAHLLVEPLTEDETRVLVGSMAGPSEEVTAMATRIHALSAGIPALGIELCRQWHLLGEEGLRPGPRPELQALLRRTRERLADQPRQQLLMDALAVWGEPADLDTLAHLIEGSASEVLELVMNLGRRGLGVAAQGGRVCLPSPAHAASWRKAMGGAQPELYTRALALLEEHPLAVDQTVRRAALMLEAGLPGSEDAGVLAAQALITSHEHPRAIALLEDLVRLRPPLTPRATDLLAQLYVQAGRYDDALRLLDAADAIGGDPDDAAVGRVLLRGRALQLQGEYAGAEALLGRLLAKQPEDPGAMKARIQLGRIRLKQGRPREALDVVSPALPGPRDPARSPVADGAAAVDQDQVELFEVAGLAALYLGDIDKADALFERGMARLTEQDQPLVLARFCDLRGMAAFTRGQLRDAGRWYQDAVRLVTGTGDRHGRAIWQANLGAVDIERGRFGEALLLLTSAIRDLGRLGHTTELASALCNLANLLILLGNYPQSEAVIKRASALAQRLGSRQTEGYLLWLTGDLRRRAGDPLTARDAYVQARDLFEQLGASREPWLLRLAEAELLAEAGHPEDGEALLAPILAPGPETPTPEAGPLALARLRLALARGPEAPPLPDEVLTDLSAHCARLQDQGASKDLWRAALVLARMQINLGQHEQARAALSQARSTLEAIVQNTPEVFHDALRADPEARSLAELWPALKPGPAEGHVPASEAPAPDASRTSPLRRLLLVNKRLNTEHRLPQLLDYIIDTVIELTAAERGFLLLQEPDGTLSVQVARNIDQRSLETAPGQVSLSRSIAEQAARGSEPVVTIDAESDARFQEAMSVSNLRLRSVLAVPLCVKGRAVGTIYVDHRMRKGAFGEQDIEFVQDLADQAAIAIENARLLAENQERRQQIEQLNQQLHHKLERREVELASMREELRSSKQALSQKYEYENIIGRSPCMMELLHLLDRITETDLPVVIQGESGTGKELVARAIHQNGPRASGPFVGENCGAIPETLLESVLFGHVKGAFTGADRERQGLFEVASSGTLFLDEVGEMSPSMQTKLLRVLQDGEVRRVGGNRTVRTDVRVIAASNKDLAQLVRQGTFRQDLFYRLNVVEVRIPPLRQRREDIPLLVDHFMAKHAGRGPRRMHPAALAALMGYAWPGNVRELENEIMRAAALGGEVLTLEDLSPQTRGSIPLALADADDLQLKPRVEHLEKELLLRALERTSGNHTQAARLLGLSRFGLLKKLRRYGLVPEGVR